MATIDGLLRPPETDYTMQENTFYYNKILNSINGHKAKSAALGLSIGSSKNGLGTYAGAKMSVLNKRFKAAKHTWHNWQNDNWKESEFSIEATLALTAVSPNESSKNDTDNHKWS
jgi:hypothetical protein